MKITQSWDTAIKSGSQHDRSVCATFEKAEGAPHKLIDIWAARVEYPALKRQVIELAAKFQPHAILIEDKASGQSLIQDLRRDTDLPILPIMPKGDKITRVAQITPMIEAGLIALPKHAHWLADFEAEIAGFPNASHDDQVDAFSQYLNWVRAQSWQQTKIRTL
ncbi:MAG: phage terminase large subunit [Rickettsiales bacterium]|nr:phage terminase large subunit [Rickettsiales bacterium]